jgi:hypothetical protein
VEGAEGGDGMSAAGSAGLGLSCLLYRPAVLALIGPNLEVRTHPRQILMSMVCCIPRASGRGGSSFDGLFQHVCFASFLSLFAPLERGPCCAGSCCASGYPIYFTFGFSLRYSMEIVAELLSLFRSCVLFCWCGSLDLGGEMESIGFMHVIDELWTM